MSISITSTNHLPSLGGRLEQMLGRIVHEAGADMADRAKTNIVEMGAVETGNLFKSVGEHETGLLSHEVTAGANYAGDVNYGHTTKSGRHIAGKPFMNKAVDETVADLKSSVSGLFSVGAGGTR